VSAAIFVAVACERGGARGRAVMAALGLLGDEHKWRVERLPGQLTSPEATTEALIRVVAGMISRGTRGQVYTCLMAAVAPDTKLRELVGAEGFQGKMATLNALCEAVGATVKWCSSETDAMSLARAEARAALQAWQDETVNEEATS
jgi:hypothetical protein